MKASVLYRVAAGLLLLFAAGHTLGFRQSDPAWGADGVLASMRSVRFDVQGFSRTYWDLFLAAGFSVGALYFFAAVLAWQLQLSLTLGVTEQLLPFGSQVPLLESVRSSWYLVIPATGLLLGIFSGLLGALIGGLVAVSYNRSPLGIRVTVEVPESS